MKVERLTQAMLDVLQFGSEVEKPLATEFEKIELRNRVEDFRKARRVVIIGRIAFRLAKDAGGLKALGSYWTKAESYFDGNALPPDGAQYRKAYGAARTWLHEFLMRHDLRNLDEGAGGGAHNFTGNGLKEPSKAQLAVIEARGAERQQLFRSYARKRFAEVEYLAETLAQSARGERREALRDLIADVRRLAGTC
jgi:hypothetical protein